MYEVDGVCLYTNIADLRCFMCNMQSWHQALMSEAILQAPAYAESHWIDGLFWLMAKHAFYLELKGWSFEPDVSGYLEWL